MIGKFLINLYILGGEICYMASEQEKISRLNMPCEAKL
jgi:hypothetical protein